jgi:DNA-binding MarR family transcriptional regulator
MSTANPKKNAPISEITTYQAGVLQAAAHRNLQKICDDALESYGISKMHWLIIGTILDAGDNGMRITDLAKKLDTTLSYLTNTINLLESKSILFRMNNGDDNRSKLVGVTDIFAEKCPLIEEKLRRILRQSIYSRVDPKDFSIYMKVLNKLSKA